MWVHHAASGNTSLSKVLHVPNQGDAGKLDLHERKLRLSNWDCWSEGGRMKMAIMGVLITGSIYLGMVQDPILGFVLLLFIACVTAYAEGK